ncbi:hypothetical protein BDZ97DRAFT_854160 [Flammula alnicola]|nr:hypothetical protein BDZ97DRAFT_854160 [Flammula alnicola]
MNMHGMHSLSSPNSSPTAADFPSHMHHNHNHPHSLSRQHSFQHVSYRGDSTSSTPLPSSPGSISMDLFDDGSCDPPPSGRGSAKRQRLDESGVGVNVGGVNGINSGDSMSLMSSVSSWKFWCNGQAKKRKRHDVQRCTQHRKHDEEQQCEHAIVVDHHCPF